MRLIAKYNLEYTKIWPPNKELIIKSILELKEFGDNFWGIGSTLEEFGVNPLMYEYVFDKAWDYKLTDAAVLERTAADICAAFGDVDFGQIRKTRE